MSRYTKTLTLGMGAYGNVSKAKDESGNEIYALKEFSLRKEQVERIKSYKYRKIN